MINSIKQNSNENHRKLGGLVNITNSINANNVKRDSIPLIVTKSSKDLKPVVISREGRDNRDKKSTTKPLSINNPNLLGNQKEQDKVQLQDLSKYYKDKSEIAKLAKYFETDY